MCYQPEDNLALQTLLEAEVARQQTTINLIASENYPYPQVLALEGSLLMGKYAEGYPGRRYYAGCGVVDQVETLALQECRDLFGAEYANVQPHAGSQANMAVYMACLKPGDVVMGMDFAAGGHLTHGHAKNFSGTFYRPVSYGVDRETGCIDYGEIERLAHKHKPRLIIAGSSAYSRVIDFQRFANIAQSVGALLLADCAHTAGLIATGLYPSPIAHADFMTATTHKTLRGPRGGFIVAKSAHGASIDSAVMPGVQGGPFMHTIAAKAFCFAAAKAPAFALYQQQALNNAQAMVTVFADRGYRIVSGGTDTHLFVLDLTDKGITGKEAEVILANVGIIVSRSCIPFDTRSPLVASGIRLGTLAMTARGMKEQYAVRIAELVCEALRVHDHEKQCIVVRDEVERMARKLLFDY